MVMISSGMVTIPSHGRGWLIVVYPHYNHHEESQAQGRLRNWQLRLLAKQMTAAVCHVPPFNSDDLGMELGRTGVEAYSDVNDDSWLKKR